ncbi:hypothetical protein SEA_EUGENEKRABS_47 [Microbacterium phage EugeneKrabs]|nr:hypothetical protein SEA_EUGENEKRABS_47 [Microbacterium phage EugeneKrabs]
MSDGANTEAQEPSGNEKYVSQIDDLFAVAWNEVYNPSEESAAGEGEGEGAAAGAGDQSGASQDQGAAAGSGAAAAPAGGALPTAGDQSVGGDESGGGADKPASDGTAGGTDGAESNSAGIAAEGLDPVEAVALFAPAREEAFKRMDASFRQAAIQELQAEIDPQFIEVLQEVPVRLVGMEVPSLAKNAQPGDKIKLLDSAQVAQYQKDLSQILESEIRTKTQEKADSVRPMATVIQESFLLFENNPDLIPNTKGFDRELAARFTEIAKTYEVKVNGKVIGYQDINVQPLINSLRADLAKQRGASGVTQAQARAEQQRQAAAQQERNDAGQFAPQAGVQSKAGMSGEPAEGYDAFWAASGVPNPGALGI